MSPAYDLLNSRMHVADTDFALEDGLLPPHLAQGKILDQFHLLAKLAEISEKQVNSLVTIFLTNSDKVKILIEASYLSEPMKRNYLQAYQKRLNKLTR